MPLGRGRVGNPCVGSGLRIPDVARVRSRVSPHERHRRLPWARFRQFTLPRRHDDDDRRRPGAVPDGRCRGPPRWSGRSSRGRSARCRPSGRRARCRPRPRGSRGGGCDAVCPSSRRASSRTSTSSSSPRSRPASHGAGPSGVDARRSGRRSPPRPSRLRSGRCRSSPRPSSRRRRRITFRQSSCLKSFPPLPRRQHRTRCLTRPPRSRPCGLGRRRSASSTVA